MTTRILLPLLAALALSACTATVTGPLPGAELPGYEPGSDSCGARGRDYLIGQHIGQIDLDSLAQTVRAIAPGQPVTMDHRPDRVNLDLDGDGVIVRVWCG